MFALHFVILPQCGPRMAVKNSKFQKLQHPEETISVIPPLFTNQAIKSCHIFHAKWKCLSSIVRDFLKEMLCLHPNNGFLYMDSQGITGDWIFFLNVRLKNPFFLFLSWKHNILLKRCHCSVYHGFTGLFSWRLCCTWKQTEARKTKAERGKTVASQTMTHP